MKNFTVRFHWFLLVYFWLSNKVSILSSTNYVISRNIYFWRRELCKFVIAAVIFLSIFFPRFTLGKETHTNICIGCMYSLPNYLLCISILFPLPSFVLFLFPRSDVLFMNICNKGKQLILRAITHRPKSWPYLHFTQYKVDFSFCFNPSV